MPPGVPGSDLIDRFFSDTAGRRLFSVNDSIDFMKRWKARGRTYRNMVSDNSRSWGLKPRQAPGGDPERFTRSSAFRSPDPLAAGDAELLELDQAGTARAAEAGSIMPPGAAPYLR